jgi:hypothetical protein
MRRSTLVLMFLVLCLCIGTCFSQQNYVAKYSAYSAYSYFSTPSLNLASRGLDIDFGLNMRSWLTMGGDFSYGNGSTTLLPNQLNSATQAKLAPYVPLLVGHGIPVAVPYNATMYTYEAGPQFNYRHFKKVTLFARPALGALHAKIQATPSNPLLGQIVGGMLGNKSLSSSDTVVFYGFGGGMTWEITKNFGIRGTVDFVHYDMFSDILNGGRNTVRATVGTKFSWGRNILSGK